MLRNNRILFLFFFCQLIHFHQILAFTKVVVPSIYHEFSDPSKYPGWMIDDEIKQKYNYSIFLYQKKYPDQPNYLSKNRGTEAGVYLNYIVDHYDSFPDVAVFVHAHPQDHSPNFLQWIGCISPEASYMSLNLEADWIIRNTEFPPWKAGSIWIEQCWRDLLAIVWNLEQDFQALETKLPLNKPILVKAPCCQQFLVSRERIQRLPRATWQKLLKVIYEQDVCHEGEPDYDHLYSYTVHRERLGPEPPSITVMGDKPGQGYGRHTQGGAMEHLAHVIFGNQPLVVEYPSKEELCANFLPLCPGSPCPLKRNITHFKISEQ